MAIYAVGDIQGCYDEFRRLLDRLGFDRVSDRLWVVGDLVNRGPSSLETLRFVKGLGDRAVCVLGNHDLHLLAVSQGNLRHQKNSSFDGILQAEDRDELIAWLRSRPLMYHCEEPNYSLVHAGLIPQWTLDQALGHAAEVERVLRGPGFHDFMQVMYGNQPSRWSEGLRGTDRLRFIVNCLTRLRYCDADGNLDLKASGAPGSQSPPFQPWFEIARRATRHDRIIFGHWSALGYRAQHNIWALDTGCIWGGQLTALKISRGEPPQPFHLSCSEFLQPEPD